MTRLMRNVTRTFPLKAINFNLCIVFHNFLPLDDLTKWLLLYPMTFSYNTWYIIILNSYTGTIFLDFQLYGTKARREKGK